MILHSLCLQRDTWCILLFEPVTYFAAISIRISKSAIIALENRFSLFFNKQFITAYCNVNIFPL